MLERSIALGLRARDFMETDILSVSPETSILDVHRMFVEEEIHGAPVVDDAGVVRGVISSLDLLRVVREECEPESPTATAYFRDQLPQSGLEWSSAADDFEDRMKSLTAADAMTRELVAVTPDTPVADVAQAMRDQHVHRVLVIEDRELVGVISTFDLLRAFVHDPKTPTQKTQRLRTHTVRMS